MENKFKQSNTTISAESSFGTQSFPTSGPIGFTMTNDFLFRALLQKNNHVLKGLIGALLHMDVDTIVSATIENPIELGDSFDDKTFILDVKVLLNDEKIIDLEMQVVNHYDWPERSLSYLCRNYDSLQAGEDYSGVTSVQHIGILDYTLFPDHPEFYANYALLNVRNHHCYSRKFLLSVLDLTQTDMATEEDRLYKIDYWARLFKVTTWEEMSILAQTDSTIKDAAETVYVISQDKYLRDKMRAREDNIRSENAMKKHYEDELEQARQDNIRSENAMKKHYEDELEQARQDNIRSKNAMKKHYEDEMKQAHQETEQARQEIEQVRSENAQLLRRIEALEKALAEKK